ncbi:MAG: DUF1553 domain-containing protein [Gammaproteobacteria bacterium]|nr:DUF1553 domain-containing protein [Gammaproteobacteria bacterium]
MGLFVLIRVHSRFVFPAVLFAGLVLSPTASKAEPSKLPTFKADVLPILAENCLMCHGQEPRQGGLDLQSAAALLQGGQSGPAIKAGSPDRSLIMEKLVSGQMPPGDARLSPEDIDRIRRWIERGAPREFGLDAGGDGAARSGLAAVSEKDVLPIFQVRCVACHGKRRQEAGLDLRTRASRLKGGRSGPAVLPGNPDQSPIIQKIESGAMPPVELQLANSVRPPTAAELQLLRRWIADGAPPDPPVSAAAESNGGNAVTEEDRKFWSFQPPFRPSVPQVRSSQLVRTPVDAFLLARLEARGLSFSPPASPLQLLRRAYLDLVGMPPSATEVKAYLQDERPDAYERMIERLLSSSHYGERWGRYWLDLAGYSDSEGFGAHDRFRPYAWRYRDYVIRSFNRDKPYSQFLMEQIAGDELADYRKEPVTPELIDRLAATGFLRTTPDPTDAPERGFIAERMNIIADEIEVLTSAVMGLTVKCARCHDHKYDPISQRDYYRLSAILQTSYDPYEWLPPKKRRIPIGLERENEEVAAHNRPLKAEIRSLEKNLLQEAEPFVDKLLEERLADLPEMLRPELRTLVHTPQDHEGGELNRKFLVLRELNEDESSEVRRFLAGKFKKTLQIGLADLNRRFPEFNQETESVRKQLDEVKGKLRQEPYVRALMDTGGRPSTTFLLKRGNHLSPGDAVTPGIPAVLTTGLTPYRVDPLKHGQDSSGRRLALARWLTQPAHPLTSRVLANQVWLRHFGRGLVPSPSNFGRSGEPPTHPQLLDWLATEFVSRDWSIKELHRIMMNSTAYRQTSRISPEALERDPENVLLSRMRRGRMDAEALYDSILKVTGRLDPRPFGPADPLETRLNKEVVATGSRAGFRRSIYTQQRRYDPVSLLEAYDMPRMTPNCVERENSTVATQALHMMNGTTVWEHSRYMAGRIIDRVGYDPERQIAQAYLQALSREPTEWELERSRAALGQFADHWSSRLGDDRDPAPVRWAAQWRALSSLCHTLLNSAEFSFVD